MLDVGICEQHSFAFVQGLASADLHPVLAHYSTFAQRGYDQLFQELVVQRDLGVVVTLDRAGLVGEDGETHQGLYDIAWGRTLPGTVLMAPKDGTELKNMFRWAHEQRLAEREQRAAAYMIRYPKESVAELHWGLDRPRPVQLGKGEVIRRASDGPRDQRLMVWAYGVMVPRAYEALESLGELAQQITLVNARFAKPFDDALLAELAPQHQQIMSLEDHALPGGFGSAVAESLLDQGLDCQLTRIGVRDELVAHASRNQQLQDHGLDPASIADRMRQALGVTTHDESAAPESESRLLQFPS